VHAHVCGQERENENYVGSAKTPYLDQGKGHVCTHVCMQEFVCMFAIGCGVSTHVIARERKGKWRQQVPVLHHSKHVKDGVHSPDPQPAQQGDELCPQGLSVSEAQAPRHDWLPWDTADEVHPKRGPVHVCVCARVCVCLCVHVMWMCACVQLTCACVCMCVCVKGVHWYCSSAQASLLEGPLSTPMPWQV